MTFDEILDRLETNDVHDFQREALQEAIKIQEDITPALLDIIAFSANNPEWLKENPGYMGFIYALFLLAQFKEEKTYPLIIKYVSSFNNDDDALENVGDFITEDLGGILASICGGDLNPIKHVIENPKINDYVRSAAIEALIVLYKHDLLTRVELIDYFSSLFNTKLEQKETDVWSSLASHCCDIHPDELYDDLVECFDKGYINLYIIDKDDIDRSHQESKAQVLARLKSNTHLQIITDVIKTMEWWACFNPKTTSSNTSIRSGLSTPFVEDGDIFTPTNKKKPKVGRNDPCPCGSGKKFKKCCLH